jgi:hypothetical protein
VALDGDHSSVPKIVGTELLKWLELIGLNNSTSEVQQLRQPSR